MQALCSQHHSCPPSPPHTVRLQGKRTSRQQQYMCEKVTRQTGRDLQTDTGSHPPAREGKQPCCSLQLKPGASPEPAALFQDIFQQNTAWDKGPFFGAASTLSEQRGRAEFTPSASWKGFQGTNPQPPFAVAVPSSTQTTTQTFHRAYFGLAKSYRWVRPPPALSAGTVRPRGVVVTGPIQDVAPEASAGHSSRKGLLPSTSSWSQKVRGT